MATEKLLLKPREAAARLSISERQLWAQTQPRGPIPATRIGSCVRYSPDRLKAFLQAEEGRNHGET
ncbi:MAG: helix-turn-helix domain-containing protein [Planctomycetaceae bacterium]